MSLATAVCLSLYIVLGIICTFLSSLSWKEGIPYNTMLSTVVTGNLLKGFNTIFDPLLDWFINLSILAMLASFIWAQCPTTCVHFDSWEDQTITHIKSCKKKVLHTGSGSESTSNLYLYVVCHLELSGVFSSLYLLFTDFWVTCCFTNYLRNSL